MSQICVSSKSVFSVRWRGGGGKGARARVDFSAYLGIALGFSPERVKSEWNYSIIR